MLNFKFRLHNLTEESLVMGEICPGYVDWLHLDDGWGQNGGFQSRQDFYHDQAQYKYISINITCRLTSNMPLFISPGSRKLKTEDVPEEQIIIEDELLELSRHYYDSSLSRGSLVSTLHQVISQAGSCRAFPFSNIIWGNIDNTLWLGSCGLSTVYSPAPTV